ncbi:MAG: RnfABCDGE type electron transport complex subunit G [Eubacteriales bacterium]|nr:RnfABCDGE type electron transport complex subunit G [Eubacteriales bacterium]
MKKIIKDTFVLMAITLVSGLLLGMVYEVTKDPIKKQEEEQKIEACQKVFEDAETFEKLEDQEAAEQMMAESLKKADLEGKVQIDEALKAVSKDGNTLGAVMQITSKEGYGGDICFTVGIQNDGTVNGISILSISETAGLGMKADTEEFRNQFSGKKVDAFTYTKTGAAAENEIDAISGATVTTNAVTNGVNAGLSFFRTLSEGGILDE